MEIKYKLYKISQEEVRGYEFYEEAIVAARSEDEARFVHPTSDWEDTFSGWCTSPAKVKVEYIGDAADHITESCVIMASFNPGPG